MGIIQQMHETSFSHSESSIIQYILHHPEEIPYLTIKELAINSYTSPASVIRVSKKLGLSGYSAFKKSFLQEIKITNQNTSILQVFENENIVSIIKKISSSTTKSLQIMTDDIDYRKLNDIIETIKKVKYINIYSSGINQHAAKYFMHGLMQLGFNVSAHTSTNQKYAQAVISNQSHYGIIISDDGENQEYIDILKKLYQKNANCLIITTDPYSTLATISKKTIIIKAIQNHQDIFISQLLYKTKLHYILDVLLILLYSKHKNQYEKELSEMKTFLDQLDHL